MPADPDLPIDQPVMENEPILALSGENKTCDESQEELCSSEGSFCYDSFSESENMPPVSCTWQQLEQIVGSEEDEYASSSPPSQCVEATFPRAFKKSPYTDFVPVEKWDRCEKDDTEAGYVLEEVRQRLLSLCAPDRAQWKSHPYMLAVRFLPLRVLPLVSKSEFINNDKVHGLVKIPARTRLPVKTLTPEQSLLLKVIYGRPEINVAGNRLVLKDLEVNYQVSIPPGSSFQIVNPDLDDLVLFYQSTGQSDDPSDLPF